MRQVTAKRKISFHKNREVLWTDSFNFPEKIYNKEISGEFRAYLEDTENSETVAKLKKQVDEELAEACNTDEDLKYLMELLNGDSQTESSAASSAEDTTEAVSTTEAASVS